MLADYLYEIFGYQIFRSVFFRAGMGYLTTYFLVVNLMPFVIRDFRKWNLSSDLLTSDSTASTKSTSSAPKPGATPILGGLVLVPAAVISLLLWVWINPYTLSLIVLLLVFALVGCADDVMKIINKKRFLARGNKSVGSKVQQKSDGISGKLRLGIEFICAAVVFFVLIYTIGLIDGKLQVPMVPIKNWHPELDIYLYFILAVLIVVGGANAVNLTDGLDSLVTIPLLSCLIFIAAAAYITGDFEWSRRLKIEFLGNDLKEIAVSSFILMSTLIAFLKFNCPPASIYMGDTGSLSFGVAVCAMFIFAKVELFLPIVGGIFVISATSSIIQRVWFRMALRLRGREYAEENRFFYKAPYHHHRQAVMLSSEKNVNSVYQRYLQKFIRFYKVPNVDKYLSQEAINNKVIWHNHIKTIWLLVIALVIYFKVR